MLEEMKALARTKDICVLATVSGGRPHCSLMAYATDDACSEIYMVTYRDTTKYRNLKENPFVSLLMDTREENPASQRPSAKALTVEGMFHEIKDAAKRSHVRERLVKRHPHLREFMANPDAEVFSIEISSFLLLDGLTEAHFEVVKEPF